MQREVTYVLTSLLQQLSHFIQYILNAVFHRGGTDDDIEDINNIWNGLLLNGTLHQHFGVGNVAFLKVCRYIHSGLF
jgi:hypothetical protein